MCEQTIEVRRILPYSMIDNVVLIDETLSPIDKVVFCVLCVHAAIDSRKCILKVKTIAKKAGCSERSVQNSLKTLEERGIIERTERFKEGSQVSSSYEVIGREAMCYANMECTTCTPPRTTCTRGVQETTPHINEKSFNEIKDSLTGEAPLPNFTDMPLAFEDGQPVDTQPEPPHNPEEVYSPDNAPDIMRPTAELFLHKTGRKGLTWEEIASLRELSASQVPSRVQKEIDTAVKRFTRKARPLHTLTVMYIASSLQHQPTLGRKRKRADKPTPPEVRQCTDAEAEAEMAEIEALQAKFDREAAERGFVR